MKAAALGVGSLAGGTLLVAGDRRAKGPNVILIMADDVGYEWFGCYGGKDAKTPNIDALAATGTRFANAFSQPVCTPTRVQIMTGRYNHRNYVCFGYLRPSETTFANALKKLGYKTCITGKWQLSGNADTVRHFGFDEHCLWNMHSYHKDAPKIANPKSWLKRYWSPCLCTNGAWTEHDGKTYGPDVVSDYLLDFITRNKDQRFLCYYPMILPHSPYTPTPDSANRKTRGAKKNFTDMVQYIDKIVGKITARLKKLGIADNTLILFTGDNGTGISITASTTGGDVKGGKSMLTHAGTHVPLIAHWPDAIKKASVCDDLIDFSDVFPTIAAAVGAAMPDDRVIDGRSFLPQIRGEKGNARQWVFCHYFGKKGRTSQGAQDAIWDHRWKLYGNGKMYNLKNDILEKSPLADLSDEARQARKRLAKAMATVRAKT
jgi:arylsulfatase A